MQPDKASMKLAELAQFQQQFMDRLYFQQPIDIYQVNAGAQGADAEQCLNAYRCSLYGTLNKALAEIFPVCHQFVGETFFVAMADRYIAEYPSTVERLDDYGESFPDFLGRFEPVRALPQLPVLAELEWAWHRAFHAAEMPSFDFEAFALACERDRDSIRFELAPQLSLLAADFPVDQLWQWHQPGFRDKAAPDLDAGPVHLAVLRPGSQVQIERLEPVQWRLLRQLSDDRSLNGLCEVMGEELTPLLPLAIQRGWICGFTRE